VYYLLNRQVAKLQQALLACQDFYNNAPCGYYSVAQDGNFIALNDTALRWLGYSRDQIIGKRKVTELLICEKVKAKDYLPQDHAPTTVANSSVALNRSTAHTVGKLLKREFRRDWAYRRSVR